MRPYNGNWIDRLGSRTHSEEVGEGPFHPTNSSLALSTTFRISASCSSRPWGFSY